MATPEVHSILGASSADRWMNCTPSARLTEGMEDEGSVFAAEGTAAHALAEWKVRKVLKKRAGRRPASDYWTDEMEETTSDYRDYIMDLVGQAKQHCKDPVTLIEQHLDFSCYVPDGFGTGDFLLVADKELNVVDFKYGRGVAVYADHKVYISKVFTDTPVPSEVLELPNVTYGGTGFFMIRHQGFRRKSNTICRIIICMMIG